MPVVFLDEYQKQFFDCDDEPCPRWMRDNFNRYERRISNVLKKLNYLRSPWEDIVYIIAGRFINPNFMKKGTIIDLDMIDFSKNNYPFKDSLEVKEFERIIQEYEKIDGYVGNAYKYYNNSKLNIYRNDFSPYIF